ncbi:glucan endo-1,3-beta-glucosidase 7 [Nymphaea colorata]|nr:glucan endo-1,3-beta-glucosidase 7 [Nymphaea colorata]
MVGNHGTTMLLFLLLLVLRIFYCADGQSYIGVNYGEVADNLPPPATVAKLLQSTSIGKVRMYGADPEVIKALAHTGIGIFIGTSNGDIFSMSGDPSAAKQWVAANILPYYPASDIVLVSVGNEVLSYGDGNMVSHLVPAMQNLHAALLEVSLADKIKVTTVHSMAVLQQSDPPSTGAFRPTYAGVDVMKQLVAFLQQTGSPLAINPYPYFAYGSDPRPETLAFCLFQQNQGRFDPNTKITYYNMFDAQVDAVHSALASLGFKDVDIVVAETGWPYQGGATEVGPSVENAKAYNGGLVAHLRSMSGTPLRPGKPVDTYIFALFDEDLKGGATSERYFGLYKPDLTMTYDVGLSKSSQGTPVTPRPPTAKQTVWCVPKDGVSDASLQANLDYACGQGIDCGPIQAGGACFTPNTVAAHAAYAMNLLYQTAGRNPWNCEFSQTATLTTKDPSYGACVYPGS